MKKLYSLFIVIAVIWQSSPVSATVSTDSTISIPFLENWESGSFTTNGWTFPYMQGNWTITTGSGDSSQNAKFTGQSSQTNYINELRSLWLDATQLTCDYIYLDFDMRLQSVNMTGTECLRIVLEFDTEADTLGTFTNNSIGPGWNHYSFELYNASKKLFRIKFLAYGQNSANIIAWSVDNIAVTYKCKPPHAINIYYSGSCGSSSCEVTLSWISPVCSGETSFIYDDGTAENGVAMYPGWVAWLGNKFPVSPDYEGFLTSFDIWFWTNPVHGNDMLTLDVFDMNMTLLGSSAPFIPPDSAWITVNVNNIWFQGPFYAMVKWNDVNAQTNYLGFDEDGLGYFYYELAMMYDGTGPPMPIENCSLFSVFLLRANANITDKKKKTPLDTTIFVGYNIYKAEGFGNTDFLKINNAPFEGTAFTDTIDCMATYYVTVLYNNCESDSSIHKTASCSLGVPETSKPFQLKIEPNPASGKVDILSVDLIKSIRITDLSGREQLAINNVGNKKLRIDLTDIKNGMYLLLVQTSLRQAVEKVIVQH